MRLKKYIPLIISVLMAATLLFPAAAFAEEADSSESASEQMMDPLTETFDQVEILPGQGHVVLKSQFVDSIQTYLSVNKGKSVVRTVVREKTDQKVRLKATVILQRKSGKHWKIVRKWKNSSNTGTLIISGSKKVGKGKYRTKNIIRVHKGSENEKIIKYSSIVKYK